MKRVVVLLAFLWSGLANLHAQRDVRSINDGWRFLRADCEAAADSAFDDRAWEEVHLPHTWNTDAYTEKAYHKGRGWYRRQFSLPQSWQGRQVFLRLDGASKAATVYVNGRRVGEHSGGYTACSFLLTPHLAFGGQPNSLAVCVDNDREEIPPISGDFTFFGGLYRDAWLVSSDSLAGRWTMTTPEVSRERATLSVEGTMPKAGMEAVCTLHAPDGTRMESRKSDGGKTFRFRFTVEKPRLWSPDEPNLYRVEVTLCDSRTGQILDRSCRTTGFRWFGFDAARGFFLNGKPCTLRGVCRHQDQKPVGAALTDEMHRRDIRLIKEMGANFVRLAHYPQDDAVLEACDRLGLLVWEEIPVIDLVPDSPAYADHCEQALREMVRQHRDHPSIIAWGYMNEILLVTQRRYKTEAEQRPVLERTLELARRLERVLKEEDTTRVSAMAFHGSDSYNKTGLSDITDIVGWNLYNGWYGGDLAGFERFLAEQHRNHPTHPMVVSEYGAGSDRRLHSLAPRPFDFSTEYQQKFLEHYLPVLEQTPYICGGAHWNFIDFASALRDESMPRINNKGLVCTDRTPKDVYHYYKAAWRGDIPVLHIAVRDWPRRTLVRRGGQPVPMPVKVYMNLPEVELFIDGQSLGKKPVENHTALFEVPFREGEPLLLAKAPSTEGMEDAVRMEIQTVPALTGAEGLQGKELAVNVGSNCFFTSDVSGLTWLPDQPYTAGSWGYIGGKEHGTQTEIHRTADNPLFQTQRTGIEAYRFDLPQGTYELELLFADIDRKEEAPAYLLGHGEGGENQANTFDISVNGRILEERFSPGRESGYFQAVRKKYIVMNDTGYLEIRFLRGGGRTFLNGIKIIVSG